MMELDLKTSGLLVEMIRAKGRSGNSREAALELAPRSSPVEAVDTVRCDHIESKPESTKDMDSSSQVMGLRALVANVMLEKVRELSGSQASELWRLTQLIDTGASLETLPRATLQLAMDFNRFPHDRRIIEEKARAYGSATGKVGNLD